MFYVLESFSSALSGRPPPLGGHVSLHGGLVRRGLPQPQGAALGAGGTLALVGIHIHIHSLAEIMVLAGTAGAGRMAPPDSTRLSSRIKCVQEHSSPANVCSKQLPPPMIAV